MPPGRTVFAELMTYVSPRKFQTCVARYAGDYKSSQFSCWDQYLCMAFAQLTYRESLRDIEACLRAVQSRLYHRRGTRQTTVRCAISAVSWGPNWPARSAGTGAWLGFPHAGHTTCGHWYSVMWASIGGSSVT